MIFLYHYGSNKIEPRRERQLVDKVRVYCRGGGGGQGRPRYGAMGGDGGNVLIKAKEGASLADIANLRVRRFIADNGENST